MNVPTLLLCILLTVLFGLAVRYLCKSGACAGCSKCKPTDGDAGPAGCAGCCAHCRQGACPSQPHAEDAKTQ